MTVVFDQYLREFRDHPQRSQELLQSRYGGRLLNSESGTPAAFHPNAPQELPEGFARVETYVLDMPCCTCTQTIYKNQAGQMLALFEHAENQRAWFGKRPVIEAQCHGQATLLVQLQGEMAASWKCGPRYLTVIGARDVEQVAELVAFLDARRADHGS